MSNDANMLLHEEKLSKLICRLFINQQQNITKLISGSFKIVVEEMTKFQEQVKDLKKKIAELQNS